MKSLNFLRRYFFTGKHVINSVPMAAAIIITLSGVASFTLAKIAPATSDQSLACPNYHGMLRAEYTLEKGVEGKGAEHEATAHGQKRSSQNDFILWRASKTKVAHQYPHNNMTMQWTRAKNGYVIPTRFFDHYQRAIEYQAFDINRGKGDKSWQDKYQIVSDDIIATMTRDKVEGQGCDRVEFYSLDTDRVSLRLQWLSAYHVIKDYVVEKRVVEDVDSIEKNAAHSPITVPVEHWVLQSIDTEKKKIQAVFAERDAYQTTDYADIGDNESDPFLMKMINLGFIEHGASGFYHESGAALGGGHAH